MLATNRFDYVECPLTTQCDGGRLLLFMMTAPEVGDPNELATFEFLELPTDEDCADGAVVPLITRHLLTKHVPMPPPLLGYVRLECMSGEEIETAKRKVTIPFPYPYPYPYPYPNPTPAPTPNPKLYLD